MYVSHSANVRRRQSGYAVARDASEQRRFTFAFTPDRY
jgi:hypothetical protein